tara:strand:+ start:2458 stop:3147 length:690 start_codon:yes stop_codon:yes gene_type:complete
MNVFLIDAINSLAPGAAFAVKTNEEIVWLDETHTQPTQENIIQKVAELEYLEEINEYQRKRQAEYPDYADYLDGVVKGDQDQIDAYIAACQAVKDKYPKVEVDVDELAARKAQALAEYQLKEYTKAMARLSQYQVALGQEEMIESIASDQRVWNPETKEWEDVMIDVVTRQAVDPVSPTITVMSSENPGDEPTEQTIENPAITEDNAERAEAQAIVDATPQSVIDTYNE